MDDTKKLRVAFRGGETGEKHPVRRGLGVTETAWEPAETPRGRAGWRLPDDGGDGITLRKVFAPRTNSRSRSSVRVLL